MSTVPGEPQYEEQYVHNVYDSIATHFSRTRYKPWPVVVEFLNSRSTGSIGIDVGCGNGKYLNINPNVYLLGSDRSAELVKCAEEIGGIRYNLLVCDGLQLPHRDNTFDFAISIAVVHHWSSRDRRVAAIQHIISKLRPQGELLLYCWALEQRNSRRGYHEGMNQDVLVPWVLSPSPNEQSAKTSTSSTERPDLTHVPLKERSTYITQWKQDQARKRAEQSSSLLQQPNTETKYRFYHLYREGELEEDCKSAGGVVLRSGYERDNWYVIVQRP